MKKRELISLIANKTELPKKVVEQVVEEMLSSLITALQNGEEVSLFDFGTFALKQKQTKLAHAQDTDELTIQSTRFEPNFKPSAKFKKSVNADSINVIMQSILRG